MTTSLRMQAGKQAGRPPPTRPPLRWMVERPPVPAPPPWTARHPATIYRVPSPCRRAPGTDCRETTSSTSSSSPHTLKRRASWLFPPPSMQPKSPSCQPPKGPWGRSARTPACPATNQKAGARPRETTTTWTRRRSPSRWRSSCWSITSASACLATMCWASLRARSVRSWQDPNPGGSWLWKAKSLSLRWSSSCLMNRTSWHSGPSRSAREVSVRECSGSLFVFVVLASWNIMTTDNDRWWRMGNQSVTCLTIFFLIVCAILFKILAEVGFGDFKGRYLCFLGGTAMSFLEFGVKNVSCCCGRGDFHRGCLFFWVSLSHYHVVFKTQVVLLFPSRYLAA